MGSGLILLVIVGAWLAVLVPMFVRSHDSSAALSSVDRFSDAMRVLSRRQGGSAGRRAVVVPRRPDPVAAAAFAHVSGGADRTRTRTAPPRPTARPAARPAAHRGLSAAERRRRALLVLLALAVVSLVLAVAVSGAFLAVHLVADALVGGFVVHCRRQAVLAAQRRARAPRAAARPAARRAPVRAGVPDRMPPRAEPARPAPARAARFDDGGLLAPPAAPPAVQQPAAPVEERPRPAAALGDEWSPVPVPRPVYATKPAAPPRVLDLTRPGRWSEGLEEVEIDLADDHDLDDILDRRRVVGG